MREDSQKEEQEMENFFDLYHGLISRKSIPLAKSICLKYADTNLLAMGYKLIEGFECEKNEDLALEYFHKYNNLESTPKLQKGFCLYMIGNIYMFRDTIKGKEYYKQSILLENVCSMNAIGRIYKESKSKKKREKAFKLFRRASEIGYKISTYHLAYYYEKGIMVKMDTKLASELIHKSAEGGYIRAMLYLSVLYETGVYFARDVEKSKHYFERAKLSSTDATNDLAVLYSSGRKTQVNEVKAIELFEKSVSEGNTESMFELALIYQKGRIVKKNYEKALELYSKSSDLGNSRAFYNLAIMYERGLGTQVNLKKAVEYYEKAVSLKHTSAMNNLAIVYKSGGVGVPKNVERCVELLSKAGQLGDINAIHNLGLMYERGNTIPKNHEKSLEFLQKSSKLGNTNSIYHLANLYLDGKLVEKNVERGIEYLIKGGKSGQGKSYNHLALMYQQGRDVPLNYDKANYYFLKAIDLGCSLAMNNYAVALEEGIGVEKNLPKAVEFYEKSSNLNNITATKNIIKVFKFGKEKMGVDMDKVSFYLTRLISIDNAEKVKHVKSLKEILSNKEVEWKSDFHMYFSFKKELHDQILSLFLISKFRRESNKDVSNVLVKGICLNIIKYLCHFQQI